ncbi:DUF4406 domain-containing protein [Eubacteriales bacterium OttesenSCG-928-A19]|nr:DUF4406 domain-containing protein [Eubacteriales bacterium OttesenSCG-928-A19]
MSNNRRPYADPTADAAIGNIMREERNAMREVQRPKSRPLVFICSPLAGAIEENQRNARRYCRYALRQGAIPFAPHLFFTQFMSESDPGQRNLGIVCGLAFLEKCREMWVFGEHLSEGMHRELTHAMRSDMHIRIRYFDERCNELPDNPYYRHST